LTAAGKQSPLILPKTLNEWLALPEHETPYCPRCPGTSQYRVVGYSYADVWICSDDACGYRWRWPGIVGGD